MDVIDVIKEATQIRDYLKQNCDFPENQIDTNYKAIPPYVGESEIKLLIIGQDPTIRNKKQRANINCTLNLDKGKGSLLKYIEDICQELDIPSIDNVYATNIYKYFYSSPPADTQNVLSNHLNLNLELLKKEISCYANALVITLGEPVLQLLTDRSHKVRNYWSYNKGVCKYDFKKSLFNTNKIKRNFYPLPHQPSLRKDFYKSHLIDYLNFIKKSVVHLENN
jgi:uracil-DNA glycosylase